MMGYKSRDRKLSGRMPCKLTQVLLSGAETLVEGKARSLYNKIFTSHNQTIRRASNKTTLISLISRQRRSDIGPITIVFFTILALLFS